MATTIMVHVKNNKSTFPTFRIYQTESDELGNYPVMRVDNERDAEITVFPSYEQLRELHILIGQFMLDHPEVYDNKEVVNAE